jgi:hypothetical protein
MCRRRSGPTRIHRLLWLSRLPLHPFLLTSHNRGLRVRPGGLIQVCGESPWAVCGLRTDSCASDSLGSPQRFVISHLSSRVQPLRHLNLGPAEFANLGRDKVRSRASRAKEAVRENRNTHKGTRRLGGETESGSGSRPLLRLGVYQARGWTSKNALSYDADAKFASTVDREICLLQKK